MMRFAVSQRTSDGIDLVLYNDHKDLYTPVKHLRMPRNILTHCKREYETVAVTTLHRHLWKCLRWRIHKALKEDAPEKDKAALRSLAQNGKYI